MDKQLAQVSKQAVPPASAESLPNFAAVKRLTLKQKAAVLKGLEEQITGPIRYSARQTYHDDEHYLEVLPGSANVSVRPLRDYFLMMGPDAAFASEFVRPQALVHFRAHAGRRYLLECAIDMAFNGVGTATALGLETGARYTVSTADRATLLFLHEASVDGPMTVSVGADRPWYLDGCELSWT